MNLIALGILAAVIVPAVVAMQRTHRRSRGTLAGPQGLARDSVAFDVSREVERDLLARPLDADSSTGVTPDPVAQPDVRSVELKGQRARLSPAL